MVSDTQETRISRSEINRRFEHAVGLHRLGRLEEAEAVYLSLAKFLPDHALLISLLGIIDLEFGRLDQGRLRLTDAIARQPHFADALNNLGLLELKENNLKKARDYFQLVLSMDANFVESLSNLAAIYQKNKQFEKTVEISERVLNIEPYHLQTLNNLAVNYIENNQPDQALACLEKLLSRQPDNVKALYNLALVYRAQGHDERFLKQLLMIIDRFPDYLSAQHHYAKYLVLNEKYEEGWRRFEVRKRMKTQTEHYQATLPKGIYPETVAPLLPLSLMHKKIHLVNEQGIGDEMFFLRFLPEICRLGAKVSYSPYEKMMDIIKPWAKKHDIDLYPNSIPQHYDHLFAVCDAPLLANHRTAPVPDSIRLEVNINLRKKIEDRFRDYPRPWIGLTWRGGTKGDEKTLYKFVPLKGFFEALHHVPGTFFDLTRVVDEEDQEMIEQNFPSTIVKTGDLCDGLESSLCLMSLLDDYIGVSNTNMHLLASIGRGAKVFMTSLPEYRWGTSGRSPWFKDFAVYRQEIGGDWSAAFSALRDDMIAEYGHSEKSIDIEG